MGVLNNFVKTFTYKEISSTFVKYDKNDALSHYQSEKLADHCNSIVF